VFSKILEEVNSLLVKKNTDYNSSYDQLRERFGPVSFLIRMHDKLNRVEQLTKTDAQVKDESIIDTLEDIIGYATLELKFREDRKECK